MKNRTHQVFYYAGFFGYLTHNPHFSDYDTILLLFAIKVTLTTALLFLEIIFNWDEMKNNNKEVDIGRIVWQ